MNKTDFKAKVENILQNYMFEIPDNITKKRIYKDLKKQFRKGIFYIFDYDDSNEYKLIVVYKDLYGLFIIKGEELGWSEEVIAEV
jgi:peptide methionine sulfoxide reductase MsrA